MAATSADFGLIGLAVMGENLALNVESRGYKVAVFNRTVEKVDEFINGKAKGKNFIGCHSIEELVKKVKKPRKIMMMVKAGQPVDELIEQLLPHLTKGDVLIDGGNEREQNHVPDRKQGNPVDGQNVKAEQVPLVPAVRENYRHHGNDLHQHLEFAQFAGFDGETFRGSD
jgi:6-phosphogluconate dehydrogenase (decarboxylating)